MDVAIAASLWVVEWSFLLKPDLCTLGVSSVKNFGFVKRFW